MSEGGRAVAPRKAPAWVKLARLQFHPMALIAYGMGAAAAFRVSSSFDLGVFVLGYAVIFFIELSTIFANEYYDFPTDRLNRNYSMFTGGTRVLVEGRLSFSEVKAGIFVVCSLIAALTILMVLTNRHAPALLSLSLILLGLFLGLGYTVPPIKFSHRGLGEVVVGVTHSYYVVLCGFIFQTGSYWDSLPWLLGTPLCFAVLAAITLSGIPDRQADRSASKNTLAVILGPSTAVRLAAVSALAAAVAGLLLWYSGLLGARTGLLVFLVVPHCALLLSGIGRLIRSDDYDRRIDGTMALALSYILWFGLIPLISLLG